MKETIRDRLWIWGQDQNSLHTVDDLYKLPGSSRMTALEGAYYLGVNNCCRIAMGAGPTPPFDQETLALTPLKQVVWTIIGSGSVKRCDSGWADLEEVIRQAKMFPNVTGGVLDDFLSEKRRAAFSPAKVAQFKERMCAEVGRPMDLWTVFYDHELDLDVQGYLDACDVITFWTWEGKNLLKLDENFERVKKMTPGKRHMTGCYMYDFGAKKPMTLDLMKYQCDKYYEWMKNGNIEGVIFCTNSVADIGLEAVEWTREWIRQIGDEEIG